MDRGGENPDNRRLILHTFRIPIQPCADLSARFDFVGLLRGMLAWPLGFAYSRPTVIELTYTAIRGFPRSSCSARFSPLGRTPSRLPSYRM